MAYELNDHPYGGRSAIAVGQRLKLMRQALGMKQREFARMLEIAPNSYSQLENGRNHPSIDILWRIIDKLPQHNIDMNWLMAGEPGGLRHDFAVLLKSMYDHRLTL